MSAGERIINDRMFADRGWRPVPVRTSELRGLDAQGGSRSLDAQQQLHRHLRSLIDGLSQQAADAI